MYIFKLETNFNNNEEKYNSIAELNQEDLLNINNIENNKINPTMMNYLSLLFEKFARYPYKKENYFFSKKFMMKLLIMGINLKITFFLLLKMIHLRQ